MRSAGSLSWFAIGRVVLVLGLLLAFILVPFALWGDRIDAAVPHLLEGIVSPWALAAAGIALLVLDVLLPIPSSVVSVALCVVLGPVAGGSSVMVGMLGAFLLGDAVGRLVSRDRLRVWVGNALWDACIDRTEFGGVTWIAATRSRAMERTVSVSSCRAELG